MSDAASVLVVDDREQNLLALEAILDPLGHRVVRAGSGEEALRRLLQEDFAVILLDVQMPGMDGFETAELIKGRERTRHVPIIFLTAISKEERHVFRGYEAGAVDYLFKPFDPELLRSKVAVLVDLWRKTRRVEEQAAELREREVREVARRGEERYRFLAESIPVQVWTAEPGGALDYVNERVVSYFGRSAEELVRWGWTEMVHPDDLPGCVARWERAVATGEPYEVEFRLRRADGSWRWHLARGLAMLGAGGAVEMWIGTNTDIDDQKRAAQAQRFLVEAGELLTGSLDYRRTLAAVARAAVPDVADWCAVDVVEADGSLRQLAVAHVDEAKVQFLDELRERYPPDGDAGARRVVATGEAEVVPEISDEMLEAAAVDELHLGLLRELGLRSYMCVPLLGRERPLGALTFAQAESGRAYGEDELALARELARRAATAIEHAQLFREAEERGRAARVLAAVADGVVLIDRDRVIRLWNPAAARITGIEPERAVGRPMAEVIPGWAELEPRVPVAGGPGETVRAELTPVEIDGRELWISGSGVALDEGTVYAFRDFTDERALETMKSDFVATVSHELRTPLAAIHGSAQTILRPDLDLDGELRDRLLQVIAEESSRLAEIVNDLLLASHLDSGRLHVTIVSCDPSQLAHAVVDSARTHLPRGVELALELPEGLPPLAADPGQLRQVLANLVENAIKYSPEGGVVRLAVEQGAGHVRFDVSDSGLGIPESEHRRVFEKFYRLDPNMTRGIGGTGLGLYICRELVRMMGGRIWVESELGAGSTFSVEIPQAPSAARAGNGAAARPARAPSGRP